MYVLGIENLRIKLHLPYIVTLMGNYATVDVYKIFNVYLKPFIITVRETDISRVPFVPDLHLNSLIQDSLYVIRISNAFCS